MLVPEKGWNLAIFIVSSEHFLNIAVFLESWKEVAPYLGLFSADVATEVNSHSEQEKKQKILRLWSAKFAFKAKYRMLIEGLLKIGRADQAQKSAAFLCYSKLMQVCSLVVILMALYLCQRRGGTLATFITVFL